MRGPPRPAAATGRPAGRARRRAAAAAAPAGTPVAAWGGRPCGGASSDQGEVLLDSAPRRGPAGRAGPRAAPPVRPAVLRRTVVRRWRRGWGRRCPAPWCRAPLWTAGGEQAGTAVGACTGAVRRRPRPLPVRARRSVAAAVSVAPPHRRGVIGVVDTPAKQGDLVKKSAGTAPTLGAIHSEKAKRNTVVLPLVRENKPGGSAPPHSPPPYRHSNYV